MSIANRPTIAYSIEDESGLVMTTYDVTVSYSRCDGYPATWGYDGGSPGEPDHVEDVRIESVDRVHVGDDSFAPIGKAILDRLREKYGDDLGIKAACYEAAFSNDCDA